MAEPATVAHDWHEATVRRLRELLEPDAGVVALAIVGSGARNVPDAWSDVDALLVVAPEALDRFFPSLDWLAPLGTVYAFEQHRNEASAVSRVCFDDLRRLDAIITTEDALVHPADRPRLPLAAGSRVLFSRSALVERALAIPSVSPPQHVAAADFEAMAHQFWFVGTVAVQKVVRGDLLVALHLGLELIQECAVLAMMLRDRAAGTTTHRDDWANAELATLAACSRPHTPAGILDSIEASAIAFDRLAARWSAAYRPRRHPLLAWIAAARRALDAHPGTHPASR